MPPSASLKTADAIDREFARDVYEGLARSGQKQLPSKYLYDSIGSALFEAITFLPEYGLTRADQRLLTEHASAIVDRVTVPVFVIELGSGSGRKTRPLLSALDRRQHGVVYYPVDLSHSALSQCENELTRIADVHPIHDTFINGLGRAMHRRPRLGHAFVLFLGSTIGNFDAADASEVLRSVRSLLQPGDWFLLGADLVKPRERLILAYDDPTGVTAAFNLNVLGRINRELGGDFDLRQFRHQVRYHERTQRLEMHLRSVTAQRVHVAGCEVTVDIKAGETIWTESSHKYTEEQLAEMAAAAGYRIVQTWCDREWGFVESLWKAV